MVVISPSEFSCYYKMFKKMNDQVTRSLVGPLKDLKKCTLQCFLDTIWHYEMANMDYIR